MDFRYISDSHQYLLNDVPIPSLTQMLRADGLSAHLDHIDPAVVRTKAEWGTRLHMALQRTECSIEFEAEFEPHSVQWLETCRRMGWIKSGVPIWKNCELPVLGNVDGFVFGFTPDRAAPEAVVEIKGTYSPHVSHGIQTALQVLGMGYPRTTPRYVVYFDRHGLKKLHLCGPAITRDGTTFDVWDECERILFDHATIWEGELT